MKKITLILLAGGLFLFAPAANFHVFGADDAVKTTVTTTTTTKADDQAIYKQVDKVVNADRSFFDKFDVKVVNGVVTIGGTVKTEAEKADVAAKAQSVNGVVKVVNNVVVKANK